jgi:uncharacterized zinc-type alcohol dehydrogenase-like protein
MRYKIFSIILIIFAFYMSIEQVVAKDCQTCRVDRVQSKGYAVFSKDGKFQPYSFERQAVGDNDILIKILYTGICHSDLHNTHSDWGEAKYPMVPGHEIVGVVTKVGKNVTKFKVSDYAGVGCLVNSCHECEYCKKHEEQYCPKRIFSYVAKDYYHDNIEVQGGFSNNYVISEDYAIKIPRTADIKKVAPLLCAGITTFSPIKAAHIKKGDKVAVAGFGGLGHMAVHYAVKKGADVTVFDITENKRADAYRLGAKRYVNVTNPKELEGLDNNFCFILSTIPKKYDPIMYMKMLQENGEMVIVGLPALKDAPSINLANIVFLGGHRKVSGSMIGGIAETQEMMNYSVKNNIYPEVKIISVKEIDEAYKNIDEGNVKFRYVIDMSTLKDSDFDKKETGKE